MRLLITGIGGLVGSTLAKQAMSAGIDVVGVDSNARGLWFGRSIEPKLQELEAAGAKIIRGSVTSVNVNDLAVGAIAHIAGQPSHDLSYKKPIADTCSNYLSTIELLTQIIGRSIPFIYTSTNKIYGDSINYCDFEKFGRRFELQRGSFSIGLSEHGVSETFPIRMDVVRTPFGVSKLASDMLCYEFWRKYGINSLVLRCGCVTGPSGTPAELHGFLGYLVRCAVREIPYTIYGYNGYQVRDNIAAEDLSRLMLKWLEYPTHGIYNVGGGSKNSVSVNEVITYLEDVHRIKMALKDGPERFGDHKWWITDNRLVESAINWKPRRGVWEVIDEMVERELHCRRLEEEHTVISTAAIGSSGV